MAKDRDKKKWYFLRFLVEHRALRGFVERVGNDVDGFKEDYGIISVKCLLEKYNWYDWLLYAFEWKKTKQGHNFWEELDELWKRDKKWLKGGCSSGGRAVD